MSTKLDPIARAALLWSTVSCMKLGIINDIYAGYVPTTVKNFSELHNYVDANEYGGFCVDEFADALIDLFGGRNEHECMPQAMLDFMNEAQGIIDDWIKGEQHPADQANGSTVRRFNRG